MSYKKDNSNKYFPERRATKRVEGYKQGVNNSKAFSKRQLEFMIRRIEKLSSAVYIVTDLVSDNEPLKWKLRQTILSILSDTSGHKLNISENVYKMVSFLDIALVGNIISEMNGAVLKYEFEGLIKIIENIKKENIMGGLFLHEKNEIGILERRNSQGHDKGHLNTNVLYKTSKGITVNRKKYDSKGHQEGREGKPFAETKNDKQNRRMIILNTVKKKKDITVRDIAILISDCSEKTLQRELVSMVRDKILKKDGDKRWSKYSLC